MKPVGTWFARALVGSAVWLTSTEWALAGDYFETVAGTSYLLESEHVTAAVHRRSGHVKGLWDTETGQQYVVESYDTYHLENRGGSRAREARGQPVDLLQNSDFEGRLVEGVPEGWHTSGEWQADRYTFDPAAVTVDSSRAYSGQHSVRLEKKPAAKQTVSLWQRFPLEPGVECKVRVRFQAEVQQGRFVLALLGEDEQGNWLGLRGEQSFPVGSTGGEWQELEVSTTGSEEVATLRAAVLFWDDQSSGAAWVDDFTGELAPGEGVQWKASEKDDVIRQVVTERPDLLILECTNPEIPGATLVKRYSFADVDGEKRILCRRFEVSGPPDGKTLLIARSNTVFDPDFRDGSLYHYVFPQGATGNQHPVLRAEDIRRPIARRDHGTDDYGRAALDVWNPRLGTGFAQYLYRADDGWEYPRGFAQTYWTPDGWQIGMSAMFINERPTSRETRYHLFFGDRLQIHYEYLNLPEFKALREESAKRVWPTVLRCGPVQRMHRPGDAWGHQIPFPFEPRYQEGGYEWGVYITRDDVIVRQHDLSNPGQLLVEARGQQYRDFFHDWRARYPLNLIGLFVYRGYESEFTRQHPDWFLSGRPPAWQAPRYTPEVIEFITDGLTQEAAYLHLGHVYQDAAIETQADWDLGHVWPARTQVDYFRILQEKAHQVGCFLWTNMRTGSVFYDVAYYEGSGAQVGPGKAWRDGADMDLMNKIYQIPGTVHVPLQWWLNGPAANYRRYHDLCLLLANRERGGPCAVPQADGTYPGCCDLEPFIATLREILPARFVRIGLEPAWWNDLETELEAYTLRLGDAYLVNAISHSQDPRDFDISVDLRQMGFEPGQRLFLWQHQSRQMLGPNEQYPDEWLDHQYTRRTLTTVVPEGNRLPLPFSQMPPEHVWITTITPTPAFIYSANGIPTQTLLPATLECQITGALDEEARTSTLQVQAARPLQVLAYWPAPWGNARVVAGDQTLPSQPMELGGERFVLMDVAEGQWEVEISAN